jgi:hypothetical protein
VEGDVVSRSFDDLIVREENQTQIKNKQMDEMKGQTNGRNR